MKVLYILVEGPTETEFVNQVLQPYFADNYPHITVTPIGIETSPGHKGGDARYEARYKPHIQRILRGKQDMIVTSLIDYYRLRSDFPKFAQAAAISNIAQRVAFLEAACAQDINDYRFVPYIQLHEFEAFVFADINGFSDFELDAKSRRNLQTIIDSYPNPELINDSPNTAPSKRLLTIIEGYEKPFHGNYIILANGGISTLLGKCPRFTAWINLLISKF
jgi:hypothetical protein